MQLRSEGWRVRPSFTPQGPTSPVTLLLDDRSLTQLAGVDPVAWQTPWAELHNLRLARTLFGTTLIADTDGRTCIWRTNRRREFAALAPFVMAAGGWVQQRQVQRRTAIAVAAVTLLSFVGYFGSQLHHGAAGATVARLKALNVGFTDLPGSWTTATPSVLSAVIGTPGQTVRTNFSTTTTTPLATSLYGKVVHSFQHCLGVTNAADRMFGAAGQFPVVQTTSKVFTSASGGGVQVASYAQYYASTSSVAKDTAETTKPGFGACFTDANADFIEGGALSLSPTVTTGQPLTVHTFAKGYRVAGIATLTGASFAQATTGLASQRQHLVVVVMTRGHYEVTLMALCVNWPQQESLVQSLVNNMVARLSPSTGTAV